MNIPFFFSDRFPWWTKWGEKGRVQNTTKRKEVDCYRLATKTNISAYGIKQVWIKRILLHIFGSDKCDRGENLFQSFLFTSNAIMQELDPY